MTLLRGLFLPSLCSTVAGDLDVHHQRVLTGEARGLKYARTLRDAMPWERLRYLLLVPFLLSLKRPFNVFSQPRGHSLYNNSLGNWQNAVVSSMRMRVSARCDWPISSPCSLPTSVRADARVGCNLLGPRIPTSTADLNCDPASNIVIDQRASNNK
ncbi:hypothetical protein KCU65_g326, partial [Aureobasidium melanogenum]